MTDELIKRFLKAKRRLFDKIYAERLNPEQRRAVFTVKGPLLVLAGAGSGKTTVLVNRIGYIIKYGNAYMSEEVPEGVSEGMVEALEAAYDFDREEILGILPEFISDPCPPWSMLAITFTNKAAREIKERLLGTFEDASTAESIWAGTFHSICVRILRRYGERLGYRDAFSIYDTDDKKRLVINCMKDLRIDEKFLSHKVVCNEISHAKDNLITPDEYDVTRDPRSRDIKRIFELYNKKLLDYNAVDFDDIIMQTVRLLEENEDVRLYYQKKFRYVCVDEYQDTNYAQFVLTKLLAGGADNIMVVGDDDQSIYKFRGATVENILNFDKTYPHANVVKLEQNYRSTETILGAANAVIRNNGKRHDKRLWSEKGEGDKIILHEAQDQIDESQYILSRITQGVRTEGRAYSDFAILYRVNELARSMESAFAKSGIPYRVLGTQRFTDRKEIRDIVAYLTTVASGEDDQRLQRIINEPKRKIGAATVEAIEGIAKMQGIPMLEVMRHAEDYVALGKGVDKLKGFVELIDSLRAEQLPPSKLIPLVFERTGYLDMLRAEGFEGEGRIANVNEFVSAAVEYEKRCEEAEEEISLMGFLEEINLVSDVDKYDETADAVVLMTVHSAKGLEFPIVFLAGMEDGIFPSVQNLMEEDELQEERRLAYVAITRAKERLYITHAKNRMMYGRTAYNPLSRFVREEIPQSLMLTDAPRRVPPRPTERRPFPSQGGRPTPTHRTPSELSRPAFSTASAPQKSTPLSFGLSMIREGARVRHAIFGEGVILSAKSMGGDILYTVHFDSGEEKRLMATFAKLEEIR